MNIDAPAAARSDYKNIVRFENVQKHFGAIHALKNINLAIGRNEIVGLIGDNGAGKSTLIKTLTGVLKPSGGRMAIGLTFDIGAGEIDLSFPSVIAFHGRRNRPRSGND
jgi:ABC-type uncharacterized transport system ATPase subunit